MLPNIYLVGNGGAGKDTQADLLVDHYGYSKMALADPLKDLSAQFLGISRKTLDKNKAEFRPLLIALGLPAISDLKWVGNELIPRWIRVKAFIGYLKKLNLPIKYTNVEWMFDSFSPGFGGDDYWINRFIVNYELRKQISPYTPVVVSDVRRPSEGRMLQERGFRGVRLDTSLETCEKRLRARDGDKVDVSFLRKGIELTVKDVPTNVSLNGEVEIKYIHKNLVQYLRAIESMESLEVEGD